MRACVCAYVCACVHYLHQQLKNEYIVHLCRAYLIIPISFLIPQNSKPY